MHLDLIHGLFITKTELRLSTTFIPAIIIMHIYNWYHSNVTGLHYVHEYIQWIIEQSPCFVLPLLLHFSLLPIRLPLLTWNPPCCDRIRPPRSQVARKRTFPFPSPCSYTPHSKIPTPQSFPDPNIHSLGRHRDSGSQAPEQLDLGSRQFKGL
jgi:hypothetical protein